MNYAEISKETFQHLYAAYAELRKSALDLKLLSLVELRVAQINGCAYCCNMHSLEARKAGVTQSVLDKLPGWKLSSAFDKQQKIALHWAEAVTLLSDDLGLLRSELQEYFSEKELVDLTTAISVMNMFTRIAITMGDQH